jgi:PAS domain S-box-containing protein
MPGAASASKAALRQMAELQSRLAEAEDTLNAIRTGAIDALVVHTPQGEQLFTLKGADQTYRALVEAMSEGALTLTSSIISYCNHHFAEMARTPMENVFGASIFDFVPSEDFRRLLKRLEKGAEPRGSIETTLRIATGERLPVLLSASRYHSDGRATVGVVVRDIAERKEAERVRQELSRSILIAQEKERQRVARDLHDSVTQLLASAKYRLHSIAAQGGQSRSVSQVLGLVEKAIGEVRLISRNLRPSELDDLGLGAALRALMREFHERTGIAARCKIKRAPPRNKILREVEMTLYRIVQESLNNAEKHSGASQVELALIASAAQISLTVKDDGRGFAGNKRGGSGLQNMTERAAMLGGRLTVWSAPKMGTRISVVVPLAAPPPGTNGANG